MTKLTITMDLGNAAFEDDPGEASRILKVAAEKLETHIGYAPDADLSTNLRDINGNTVGRLVFEG